MEWFLLLVILVAGLAVFLTRVMPFWLLRKQANHPLILHFGRFLPLILMVLLVVYSLKETLVEVNVLMTQLVALLITGVLHGLWRQPLLSIGVGTLSYMLLLQW